tara:strand:+ start:152 stop:535 length:384 start_codon:yes stop_codon:yes gene_type:complete
MNPFEKIPESEIQFFKEKVQRWLNVDNQIADLESQIKELKKVRNKELEPEITKFMTTYNVKDLNTGNGKLRCAEVKTKQSINKSYIKENLSQFIKDPTKVDDAINHIWNDRQIVIKHKLKKVTSKKQ